MLYYYYYYSPCVDTMSLIYISSLPGAQHKWEEEAGYCQHLLLLVFFCLQEPFLFQWCGMEKESCALVSFRYIGLASVCVFFFFSFKLFVKKPKWTRSMNVDTLHPFACLALPLYATHAHQLGKSFCELRKLCISLFFFFFSYNPFPGSWLVYIQ